MDSAVEYITSDLPALLELLQHSDIREIELDDGDLRIRLRRTPASEETANTETLIEGLDSAPLDPEPLRITSPLVGTFYRAAEPGAPVLVDEGSPIDRDTVVGIVEALHVLTDVEAGCSGVVSRVLATDGQPVEYGQTLFEVTPGG